MFFQVFTGMTVSRCFITCCPLVKHLFALLVQTRSQWGLGLPVYMVDTQQPGCSTELWTEPIGMGIQWKSMGIWAARIESWFVMNHDDFRLLDFLTNTHFKDFIQNQHRLFFVGWVRLFLCRLSPQPQENLLPPRVGLLLSSPCVCCWSVSYNPSKSHFLSN